MTTNVEETKIVIPFGAVPKIESFGDFHDGRVVRLFEDRLVMSSQGGKEYSFRAAADANMCCEGICCRI